MKYVETKLNLPVRIVGPISVDESPKDYHNYHFTDYSEFIKENGPFP